MMKDYYCELDCRSGLTGEPFGPHYHTLDGTGRGGSGMTSGASLQAGSRRGATHLVDKATGFLACGRKISGLGGGGVMRLSDPRRAPDRVLTCSVCRKKVL